MKPGGGKAKGSAFERKVAKLIRVAARQVMKVKKRDVYRTPMSGGHVFAKHEDPSDLVISKRVRKWFPFAVECKHYRRIRYMELLDPAFKRGIHVWIEQVKKSATKGSFPLVVMMENRGDIYCAVRSSNVYVGVKRKMEFMHGDEYWYLMLFSTFLKSVFKQ